jgi:hypothetical protein
MLQCCRRLTLAAAVRLGKAASNRVFANSGKAMPRHSRQIISLYSFAVILEAYETSSLTLREDHILRYLRTCC